MEYTICHAITSASGIWQDTSRVLQLHIRERSVLEWVIDQYQANEEKRSGIVSDPNREDDPEYIARLVGRVVTVSVETVRLVEELAQVVTLYGIQ